MGFGNWSEIIIFGNISQESFIDICIMVMMVVIMLAMKGYKTFIRKKEKLAR
ncbi:hypothetical protein WKT22_03658 [Candidatus Lokiarchaeum ossiferum]